MLVSLRWSLVVGVFLLWVTVGGSWCLGVSGYPCSSVVLDFCGSDTRVAVDYCLGLGTFTYSYPFNPTLTHESWVDNKFLYYNDSIDLELYLDTPLQGRFVVFDPDLPEGYSPVDLYYDEDLRRGLTENISAVVSRLRGGVTGFVLGDEWPRGLDNGVTIRDLVAHNDSFHGETGRWMRGYLSSPEKEVLAEWFYARSVEAWNLVARELRSRFPDIYLGTNIDLVWRQDLGVDDVPHWAERGVWRLADLEPYDFVVTHYFTGMVQGESLLRVDEPSLNTLREGLGSLVDSGLLEGRDWFLLLAAHNNYPRVVTPAQMIEEWKIAMEFSEHLAGVGWFTFDIWMVNGSLVVRSLFHSSTPMWRERRYTVRDLSQLDRCGWCTSSCRARLAVETDSLTLGEGGEAGINLTVEPGSWLLGKIQLREIEVHPQETNATIQVGGCLAWRNGTSEGCIHDRAPWIDLSPGKPGTPLTATIPVKVPASNPPQNLTAILTFYLAIGKQETSPCGGNYILARKTVNLEVTENSIPEPYPQLALSLLLLPTIGWTTTQAENRSNRPENPNLSLPYY